MASRKLTPWTPALVIIGCIALMFVVTDLANDHLRSVGWRPHHNPSSAARFLTRQVARIPGIVLAAGGQLLYLTQATFGLVLVGPLYVCLTAWRQGLRRMLGQYERDRVLLVAFIFVTSGAFLSTSAMQLSSGGRRADHLIYGRYSEPVLALYIAFGLLVLCSRWYRTTRTSLPFLIPPIVAGLTAFVQATRGDELASRHYVAPNIFGVLPFIVVLGLNLAMISMVAMLAFTIAAVVAKRSSAGAVILVALAFSVGSGYAFVSYFHPFNRRPIVADTLPTRIRQFGIAVAGYDLSGAKRTPGRFYTYQYLLPGAVLRKFNTDRGDTPPSPVVIAKRNWKHAETLDARVVEEEPRTNHALWILPQARHLRWAARSYIGVDLGWETKAGVWESGFHWTEGRRRRGGPMRWTNGQARLVVPIDRNRPPTRLAVHLMRSSRTTRVLVNEVELLNGPVPRQPRVVSLSVVPVAERLTIQLLSETVLQKRRGKSSDARTLGVAVRSIRLLRE
jgi:hypothetical protein